MSDVSTDTRPTGLALSSLRAGTVALVLGLLFLAATAFTYVLNLTDLVNPPNWARAVGLVWLPIGFVGTPIAYAIARYGPGRTRTRGRVGVALALVGLLAFMVLLYAVG